MNYKLSIGLLALAALLAFSCKKKKKEEEVPSITSGPDGYFFKAKVNGTQTDLISGLNRNEADPAVTVDDLAGDAKEVSYFSSVSGYNSFNSFFEISRPNVEITDGNDSDEMTTIFMVGDKDLEAGSSDSYSITYHGANSSVYFIKFSEGPFDIQIDSVVDLGSVSNKRSLRVVGSIDSVRVYEYDLDNLEYTSNYVDITDAEFSLPFKSNSTF